MAKRTMLACREGNPPNSCSRERINSSDDMAVLLFVAIRQVRQRSAYTGVLQGGRDNGGRKYLCLPSPSFLHYVAARQRHHIDKRPQPLLSLHLTSDSPVS